MPGIDRFWTVIAELIPWIDNSLTDSGCFQPDVSSRESGPGYLAIWVSGYLGVWVCPDWVHGTCSKL